MGARLKLTEEDAPPSASFGAKMEELRSKYLAPSAERNWYLRSAGSDRVAVSGRGRSFRNRYVGISERTAFLGRGCRPKCRSSCLSRVRLAQTIVCAQVSFLGVVLKPILEPRGAFCGARFGSKKRVAPRAFFSPPLT